jgi:hypothetical protein
MPTERMFDREGAAAPAADVTPPKVAPEPLARRAIGNQSRIRN